MSNALVFEEWVIRSAATEGAAGEPSPAHNEVSISTKKSGIGRSFCGDGRSRTAVQTKSQVAFYTLILSLIVGPGLPKDRPPGAYPLGT